MVWVSCREILSHHVELQFYWSCLYDDLKLAVVEKKGVLYMNGFNYYYYFNFIQSKGHEVDQSIQNSLMTPADLIHLTVPVWTFAKC